jgi:hypothetical protein
MDTKANAANTYDIYLNNTDGEMEFITRIDAGSAAEALKEFYYYEHGKLADESSIEDADLFGLGFDSATLPISDTKHYLAQLFQI